MKTTSKRIRLLLIAMGFSVAMAGAAQAANLTQYWPFDDSSGSSTVTNFVAGGNTGELVGLTPSTAWTTDHPSQLGHSSSSVAIMEANGYVNLKNIKLKGSGTISLWINPASYDSGDIRLFSQVPYVSPYGGVVRLDSLASGQVQSIGGGGWIGLGSVDQVPVGSWTHLAFVYDEGVVRLWINGVKQRAVAFVGLDFDSSSFGLGAPFDVGGAIGGPYGFGFMGAVDDVSIWDGPVSEPSIAKLATGTRPAGIDDLPDDQGEDTIPAKLVQYFPLDEAPGSTAVPNAVAGGNTGQYLNGDPSSAWVSDNKPTALTNSIAALLLDGADAQVNLGNVGLRDVGTISLWVNSQPRETAYPFLYALVPPPEAYSGIIRLDSLASGVVSSGAVISYYGGWQNLAVGGTIPAARWTHVAFVHSLGQVTLWVDGALAGSAKSGLDFDLGELSLGARVEGGVNFRGLMDDVSFWDRPLQPSSVRKLASGVSPSTVVDNPATEPPFLLSQPTGVTVILGEPASLSITAAGAKPLRYQWIKDGAAVPGATNNPLAITSTAVSDDGQYQVIVANAFGSETSHVAALTVDPGVPVITTQPLSVTRRGGTAVQFEVQANGAKPLNYQWYKGSSPVAEATGATYSIPSVSGNDAGNYTVIVSNVSGTVSSQVATLTVVSSPPGTYVNLAPAGSYAFSGMGAAPDPAGTVWNQVTEAALAAAPDREISLLDADGNNSAVTFTSESFADVTTDNAADNGGGNNVQRTYWHVGSGNETPTFGFRNLDPNTKYDVYIHGIATDFGTGNTERFTRVGGDSKPLDPAPSTGFPVLGEDYVVFERISGGNEILFTAGEANNPSVFSTVTGLQLMISTDAPRILQSPVGRFVRQGANVTFTADIVGLAPFDCQWLKDGAPINGANSAAFNISSVKLADAGLYSVVVGNSAGSATSSAATLRVQTAPPAVNVNLVHSEAVQYVDLGAAPDTGTVWNGVTEQMLIDSGTREFSLTDSDGVATELRFFSGSFGEPNSGGFGDNGGGNALQATYWHVGGGKVSPEFGLRGLDANKTYDLYVYGMATDFGVGWGEAYTLIGTGTKTLDPIPDTGWPVEGEDYVVFRGVTGAQEARLTSGMAGGYFSTVTGLQVIEAEPNIVLLIQRSGPDEISISWTGGGTLQESDSLTGQWQPVSSSANPYRTQTSAVQKFYRVKK